MESRKFTHICLHVLVLKIEGMLPDVDADNGQKLEKRVLVRSGSDFKPLGSRVYALYDNK